MSIEDKLSRKNTTTLKILEKQGLSKQFLFYSSYAQKPQLLNASFKNAYQRTGLTKPDDSFTVKGRFFFNEINDLVAAEKARNNNSGFILPPNLSQP